MQTDKEVLREIESGDPKRHECVHPMTATAMLLFATVIWGWTFTVVKDAVDAYPLLWFLAIRFAIGSSVLVVVRFRKLLDLSLWRAGLPIGLAMAGGYYFQTTGLQTTTSTNCGLITGLFVVFAPLTAWVVYRRGVSPKVIVAIGIALFGLYLLVGLDPDSLRAGDFLTLLAAFCFGLHITLLDHRGGGRDPVALAAVQMLITALIFFVAAACSSGGSPPPMPNPFVWWAILLTGVLATAVCFAMQTTAQQSLPGARVAVILTMEPVFAAIFGYSLHGDRLQAIQWFGGGLIVAAMLATELIELKPKNGE
jgi:drug/metabolite transporter (DMT)-like permease